MIQQTLLSSAVQSGICDGPKALVIPGCTGAKAADKLKDSAGDVAASAAGDVWQQAADKITDAVGDVFKTLSTIWVDVPSPDPSSDGAGGAIQFIQNSTWYYMAVVMMLGIMIAGVRMAWEQRAEPLRELLGSFFQWIVISSAGLLVLGLVLDAGDAYSKWILDRSTDGHSFGHNITAMFAFILHSGPTGVVLVIVLGFILLVASVLQVAVLILRTGMLVVLAGLWPLANSATHTKWGLQWSQKVNGWLLALVLYKPVAATIYAAAFKLQSAEVFGGKTSNLLTVIVGLVLMCVAIFAIKGLMQVCVPMAGQMAFSGGTQAVGATMTLATGAVAVSTLGAGGAAASTGSGGSSAGSSMAPLPASAPSGSAGAQDPPGASGQGSSGQGAGGQSPPGSGTQGPSGGSDGQGPSGAAGDSGTSPGAGAGGPTGAAGDPGGSSGNSGAGSSGLPPMPNPSGARGDSRESPMGTEE